MNPRLCFFYIIYCSTNKIFSSNFIIGSKNFLQIKHAQENLDNSKTNNNIKYKATTEINIEI